MDNLLTPKEAAERLRVPISWVYERTRMNAMPGMVRIGKYIRISERVLQALIENAGECVNENECGLGISCGDSWTHTNGPNSIQFGRENNNEET
jgi:excisionase family DNA binding protein